MKLRIVRGPSLGKENGTTTVRVGSEVSAREPQMMASGIMRRQRRQRRGEHLPVRTPGPKKIRRRLKK